VTTLNFVGNQAPQFAYASGYLLFLRETTLFAQPFDLTAGVLAGEAVPVASPAGRFAVSANGVLAYFEPDPAAAAGPDAGTVTELRWFGRDGTPLGALGPPGVYLNPRLSPDGRRVAVDRLEDGNHDVWTIDVARGVPVRLTFDAAGDTVPVWSPDGREIVFASGRDSGGLLPGALYRRAASGAGTDELVYSAGVSELVVPMDWVDAGVLFARANIAQLSTNLDVWQLPSEGERVAAPVLATPAREGASRVSPDGRWVAYASDESGTYQIFVQPFPDVSKGRWQISTRGGIEVKWRADGRELYYLASDGNLMAVDVEAGETFTFGEPRVLFHTGLAIPAIPFDFSFDVLPDGERFLINVPQAAGDGDEVASSAISVVINWPATLGGLSR
jgi:hypothetical protein